MRREVLVLASALALAGCSFSQPPAPVRDRPGARHGVRPPADMPAWYKVRPGDNLYRIALDHGLDYRQLADWNDLGEPDQIKAGAVLRLKPRPSRQVVAPAVPEAPDDPPAEWAWPARGALIGRFDGSAGGNGLDIAGQRGSPVLAAAPGRVVYAGDGLRGYGKLIIIRHSQAILSAYGHNEKIRVGEGQTVKFGQHIADMGDSDTDRVKLHFEIREYGKPVDPMNYLPGR